MSCSYSCILLQRWNGEQACTYVQNYCQDQGSFILQIYLCQLKSSAVFLTLCSSVLLLQIFFFLSILTEHFLQPSLRFISERLQISQAFAGATFLALGNGTPDLVVAAFNARRDKFALDSVGSVFGAGLFSFCIILGAVIGITKSRRLRYKYYVRDIGFYLLGCGTVLIFGVLGKVNTWMAALLLFQYIVYIVVVFMREAQDEQGQVLLSTQGVIFFQSNPEVKRALFIQLYIQVVRTCLSISIPSPSPAYHNRLLLPVQSFVFPFFFLFVCNDFTMTLVGFVSAFVAAILLTLLALNIQYYNRLALFYSILSFLSSLLWIMLLSDLVQSYVAFLQLLTGTNQGVLQLTAMGAINSLGDFFSITAVAKVGLPVMAVAGVLGGQNFNQLAGLGTALLMSCLFNGGEVQFPLFPKGDLSQENFLQRLLATSSILLLGGYLLFTLFFLHDKDGFFQPSVAFRGNGLYLLFLVMVAGTCIYLSVMTAPQCQS